MVTEEIKKLQEEANGGEFVIRVNFTKMTEMNVYLYGGRSRKSAYENITNGNIQATLGLVYNISAYRGFLIVAYPNKNVDTEFAFDYWVEALYMPPPVVPPVPAEWYEF